MNRSTIRPAVLAATVLLVVTAGCQSAEREGAPGGDTTAAASASGGTLAESAPAAQPTAAMAAPSAMLDPAAVTREELLALPGMDAAAADAFIAERPYADMRALDRVLAKHLSEQERDSVYARVWKPIDLNSASAQEIMLIPGVGERMRHEFEEYRPYRSMEQFRREIGKYVDDTELARLERYVSIR